MVRTTVVRSLLVRKTMVTLDVAQRFGYFRRMFEEAA